MSRHSPGTKVDVVSLLQMLWKLSKKKKILSSSIPEPPPIESSEVRQKPLKIIFQLLMLSPVLENIKTSVLKA